MSILDDLMDQLEEDAPVRSIMVGVHWTAVCSRHCGLASTITGNKPHGHDRVQDVGQLQKKTARQLAEYARSDNLLEASIGVAAINSLLSMDEKSSVEINAFDVLSQHGRGKNVAIVGHFPFIPKLRNLVGQLWVLEQKPAEGDYSSEEATNLIPQADVVAITSSALINHTLDGLLALCNPGTLVMMLGPSTPLSPLLFNYRVKILSGSKVVDETAVIRTVSQGAMFQQVEGVRLLTFTSDW